MLKVPPSEVPGRVEALVERLRVAEKELERLRAAALLGVGGRRWPSGAVDVGGVALVAATAPEGTSGGDLRKLATDVRSRLGDRPGVVALFAPGPRTRWRSWSPSPRRRSRPGSAAGDLAKAFLPAIDGRGGGKTGHGPGRRHPAGRHSGGHRALRAALADGR